MAAPISKEEYLKRYTTGAAPETKKKKKKRPKEKTKPSGFRIIDEDIDFSSTLPTNLKNSLDDDIELEENNPTVVEVVDERPEHVKEIEQYRKNNKWRTVDDNLKDDRGKRPVAYVAPILQEDEEQITEYTSHRHDSDSDNSPKIRRKRHDSISPERDKRSFTEKQKYDSESDQTPIRTQRYDSDSDQSPSRTQRHDSDSDQSPVRKTTHDSDSDQSPPRKKKYDSDSDQSPPRKKRRDPNSDQSPARGRSKNVRDHSTRNKRHSSKDEENRNSRDVASHKTKSSPRRKHQSERKSRKQRDEIPRKSRWDDSDDDLSPQRKSKEQPGLDERGRALRTLGGARAGLSSAKQMRSEADSLKQKEDEFFNQIDESVLGRNAQTVYRGRKKEDQEKKQEELEREEKRNAKYKQWGKGVKQSEDHRKNIEEALHETSKPLARYKDDTDLDAMLKEQDREGDPMLAFIKKKTKAKSGQKELPKYKGPAAAPNRFGIQPGYRWDGVNRSNGFEKQLFAKQADRKATAAMAYKWSTEDM